ncbi:MAG: hypothetical protein QM765_12305 [Myxococcales bacterium]
MKNSRPAAARSGAVSSSIRLACSSLARETAVAMSRLPTPFLRQDSATTSSSMVAMRPRNLS